MANSFEIKNIFLTGIIIYGTVLTSVGVSGQKFGYGWKTDKSEGRQLGEQYDFSRDPVRARMHPFDPLTEMEINVTSSIIKSFRPGDWLFNYISLKEPEKSTILPYFLSDKNPPALSVPRKSFSVLVDPRYSQVHEVVVNLDTRMVESWIAASSHVELPYTAEEALRTEKMIQENEEVVERCRRHGWTNMSFVIIDMWPIGYVGDRPEFQGRRTVKCYLYGREFEMDNIYAHPFDFSPIVDLVEGKLIGIEELPVGSGYDTNNKMDATVPHRVSNFDPDLLDPAFFRKDIRPVKVSQPQGASYTITGHEIQWQKFKMRIGFNAREGLVIYNVKYNDSGNVRPLFYRMSLPELFVPYGDPRPPLHKKYAFDAGQLGFGVVSNTLQPEIDCLGQAYFFDGILYNENGKAKKIPQAICVSEEDAGILWKHTDFRTKKISTTRSLRLSIAFVATVGNYDYIFTWYFYQDANIEVNVKLTGILSTNLLAANATGGGYGTVVFPQIDAQNHQHYFTLRLDAEIDGNRNSVMVSDIIAVPDATGSMRNPYGQGITTRKTLLKTAINGRTNGSPENSRTWHIQNPTSLNPYTKQPVAWKLIPWASPPLHVHRDSPIYPRAEYLDYNTWVTPYEENQIFPGGFYLNNSGLPEWVGRNRNANIENVDIVLWHNFGISHVPRVEEFPVMSVESCGVLLKPANFFKENPSLDVPPPSALNKAEL